MATTREPNPKLDTAAPADPVVEAAPAEGWQRWAATLTRREPERIAGFGGVLLAGLLAGVATLYAFVWLADEVLRQQTLALDTSVNGWFDQFSSPPLTLAARLISLLGSEALFLVGGVLLVVFVLQRRWGAAVMLVMASAGTQLLNDLLKELFHRTRPIPLGGLIEAQQYSFPSGHAMVSAAFYFYVAYLTWRLIHGWWRVVVVVGLVLLVLLIGVARLYLHAHYLTDVAAGYLAGSLWTDGIVLGSRVLTLRSARSHRELHPRTLNG